MGCCGGKTIKSGVKRVRQIATGYSALIRGKKYEFTDDRVRVCQKCDYRYWIGRTLWCSICKCFVPGAARVKDKTCPKNKWAK